MSLYLFALVELDVSEEFHTCNVSSVGKNRGGSAFAELADVVSSLTCDDFSTGMTLQKRITFHTYKDHWHIEILNP